MAVATSPSRVSVFAAGSCRRHAPAVFPPNPMRPVVIALIGLPGTGKSTLGHRLLSRLPRDFSLLDLDTLTQPLVRAAIALNGVGLRSAAETGALRTLRDAQYACLFGQLRALVSLERNVMFVAPMTHELDDPAAFRRAFASLHPARPMIIRTVASCEVVRARLRGRGDFLDELRLSRWDSDEHRYSHPAPLPMPGLELDSSERSPDALAAEAHDWLACRLGWSRAADRAGVSATHNAALGA
jgi:hypothetical protein